jgi:hypothetical protein
MSLSYDEIIREVNILARPYSQSRLAFSKWRSYNAKASEVPETLTSIHDIEDKTYALIYRPSLFSFEAFQFDSIIKRTQIKRNEFLYKEISSLWKTINPFHLPGISKNVYQKFFEFMHFSVLNTNASIEEVELISKVDLNLDFTEGEILNYVNFIDSFFECLDSYAKSMLIGEYCRITKRLTNEVKRSNWIKNIDLHNKIFSDGLKPVVPSWANFKNKPLDIPLLPRNNPLTPTLAHRQLNKTAKRERDSFDVTLMKFSSPWETRTRFKMNGVNRSPESSYRKNKPHHLRVKTGEISPLLKRSKNFKHRNLIEDVVRDRSEKVPDINVQVIRTPLRFLI